MNALAYKVVEDGWFVPRGLLSEFDLVYDADGALVPESTLQRDDPGEVISRAPSRLPPGLACARAVAGHLVFLGPYDFGHYGHWTTEGLARFWYLLRHAEERGAAATVPQPAYVEGLRRLVGYFRDWRIALDAFQPEKAVLRGSTKADRIIVPECSMRNRAYVRPVHLEVARKIAATLVGDEWPAASEVPVYLSRTRLKPSLGRLSRRVLPGKIHMGPRRFDGELAVEKYCRSRGFRIVHPQQLSLADQVRLFNTHDVFIGIEGSAFHTSLFRLRKERACHIYLRSAGRAGSRNFDLIDSLTGNASHRIVCATERRAEHFSLDARAAIDGISTHLSAL